MLTVTPSQVAAVQPEGDHATDTVLICGSSAFMRASTRACWAVSSHTTA